MGLCLLAMATAVSAAQGTQVSSNWAGYVAAPAPGADPRFSSVSGSWTEPTAACKAGQESYSAIWVGLGGASTHARSLEQVGTDADCTHSGHAAYSAWFELLPAEAVSVQLPVIPGDRVAASVTVKAHHGTLRLSDLTTGRHFTTTRRLARMDTSTAEWIVEAPSLCDGSGSCRTEPLTDFNEVAFNDTSATAHGHTGPIADAAWSATALELRQSSPHTGHRSTAGALPASSQIVAAPSSAAGAEGAFAVRWQELAVKGERSTPPPLP